MELLLLYLLGHQLSLVVFLFLIVHALIFVWALILFFVVRQEMVVYHVTVLKVYEVLGELFSGRSFSFFARTLKLYLELDYYQVSYVARVGDEDS